MAAASSRAAAAGFDGPIVVCITDAPDERARLARMFDGAGILVLASDPGDARHFLDQLRDSVAGGAREPDDPVIRVGGLQVDLSRHEATWHRQTLPLTPYELKVLACLASQPGRVWTYRQLHDRAWEGRFFTGPAALQSVIKRLRAKLRHAGAAVEIRATRGVGFRLEGAKDLVLVSPGR